MIAWIRKVRKTEESGRTSRFLTWATRMEAVVEIREDRRKNGCEGGK